MTETLTAAIARALLPARPESAHKYDFGRVLAVAGSLRYPGAAVLCTAAAARAGAGVVTLATTRDGMAAPGRTPEVTLLPLPADDGALGTSAADALRAELPNAQALLVGPGIGRETQTAAFLARLLGIETVPKRSVGFQMRPERPAEPVVATATPALVLPPTVLDADALTLLATLPGWWEHVAPGTLVLTPHSGELQRLLGETPIGADLASAAIACAQRWQQIVVAKGPTTVVAAPDGVAYTLHAPNPALATAGTGDVLAGMIAGLLAQGAAPTAAAVLGVYLHAQAGAQVRAHMGDAGALASDLLREIPLAIRALREGIA